MYRCTAAAHDTGSATTPAPAVDPDRTIKLSLPAGWRQGDGVMAWSWTAEQLQKWKEELLAKAAEAGWKKPEPLEVAVTEIPARAFVSHSYMDTEGIRSLLDHLPPCFGPVLFAPVDVPPSEFVSTRLIDAIRAAPALVYLQGAKSEASFWVALERDVALRAGKQVFAFDPATGQFRRHARQPDPHWIYAIFPVDDSAVARSVVGWMVEHRGFQIAPLDPLDYARQSELIGSLQDYSGFFVGFVGQRTIRDLPLQLVRISCEDWETGGLTPKLVLACLDPPGDWIPSTTMDLVVPGGIFDLTDGDTARPWSANRVDDLIVALISQFSRARPFLR